MEVIIKNRGKGKTEQLINKAKEYGAYIVCFSHSEARRVFLKATLEMDMNIPHPICISELMRDDYGRDRILLFDNIDIILPLMFNRSKVIGMSLTNPKETERDE